MQRIDSLWILLGEGFLPGTIFEVLPGEEGAQALGFGKELIVIREEFEGVPIGVDDSVSFSNDARLKQRGAELFSGIDLNIELLVARHEIHEHPARNAFILKLEHLQSPPAQQLGKAAHAQIGLLFQDVLYFGVGEHRRARED